MSDRGAFLFVLIAYILIGGVEGSKKQSGKKTGPPAPPGTTSCDTQTLSTTNMLTNGDFQNPTIAPATPFLVNSPGNIPSWASLQSQIGHGTTYNSQWTSQVIKLNPDNTNTQYSQSMTLNPTSNYKIQIYCAAQVGQPLNTSGFMVLLNGNVVIYEEQPSDYNITYYSFDFNAVSSTNTITVQGLGLADEYGTSCDNVGIYEIVVDTHRLLTSTGTCQCQVGFYPSDNLAVPTSCVACSSVDANCVTCTNVDLSGIGTNYLLTCTQCSTGYIPSGASCIICSNVTLIGCLDCIDPLILSPTCTTCDALKNFINVNGTCKCDIWYYQSATTCISCANIDALCLTCSDANTCLTCSVGTYASASQCLSCSSISYACTYCTNSTQCLQCTINSNYVIANNICECATSYYQNLTTLQCQTCSSLNLLCLTCSSNSTSSSYQCSSCAWGYFPQAQSCPLCSTVLIQCLNCSMDAQTCYNCNQTNQYFIDATNSLCQQCSVLQLGCINCSTSTTCYDCNILQNYLLDNATQKCYKCQLQGCAKCITNYTCEICGSGYQEIPNEQLQCLKLGCEQYVGNDNIFENNAVVPKTVYSAQQCGTAQTLQILAKATGIISYVTLVSAIFSSKIIGLELFGVLQIAYFSLADHSFVNLYLSPFLNWRYMNGFNLQSNTNNNSTRLLHQRTLQGRFIVPNNVLALGYTHSFIENMNVMLIVLLTQFFLSLILIGLTYLVPCLKRISQFMFKQIFITLLIFNCFNISFSAGLHFRYSTPENTQNYVLSTIAAISAILLCLFAIFGLMFLNKQSYGEYKRKFKNNFGTQSYISISVAYRMLLGIYLAYGNDYLYGSLIILAISLSFMIYNLVNLPFIDAYQNYRASLCHFTIMFIILVANFYTVMKANISLKDKSVMFTPAKIQIILILACISVSSLCLTYELYLIITKFCSNRKNEKVLPRIQQNSKINFETTQCQAYQN